jgi:hypothetical protein
MLCSKFNKWECSAARVCGLAIERNKRVRLIEGPSLNCHDSALAQMVRFGVNLASNRADCADFAGLAGL